MKDKGVPKKGDMFVRKAPRQRGNTDIRPFKAPRQVTKGTDSNSNTEVQAITETTGSTPEMLKSPDISQEKSSDNEDNIPVASLLKAKVSYILITTTFFDMRH